MYSLKIDLKDLPNEDGRSSGFISMKSSTSSVGSTVPLTTLINSSFS